METYQMIYQGGSGEIVEKKSRFIAHVFSVTSEEEAQKYIDETKKKYWDARHNCYAFIVGTRGEITRCSDDGEPSGTAGRPILEVLTGSRLRNVLVVVTRYFGGTLLGTGGLVRAYCQAAQAGLEGSTVIQVQEGFRIGIRTDYNGIGKLQYIAAQDKIPVLDTLYTDQVEMIMVVPSEDKDGLVKKVTEATAGQAELDISDPLVFYLLEGKPVVVEKEV